MKKLVTLLLTLALVLTLVCSACAEDKPLKIMLSNAYYTAPYCAAYDPSAEATAKELGIVGERGFIDHGPVPDLHGFL